MHVGAGGDSVALVFVHLLSGDFLVNGAPIGRLPPDVVQHDSFKTLFGAVNLSATPLGNGEFRTRHPYVVDGHHWAFFFRHMASAGKLWIRQVAWVAGDVDGAGSTTATNTNTNGTATTLLANHYEATFVPTSELDEALPKKLRSNEHFAHWFSPGREGGDALDSDDGAGTATPRHGGALEFRPFSSQTRELSLRPTHSLQWRATTNEVCRRAATAAVATTASSTRTNLASHVDTHSEPNLSDCWQLLERNSCATVAGGLLGRLDGAQHIAVWQSRSRNGAVLRRRAELLRYHYSFEQESDGSRQAMHAADWTSVEHPGLRVAPALPMSDCTVGRGQSLGTLVGLRDKLVLEPVTIPNAHGDASAAIRKHAAQRQHRCVLVPNAAGFHVQKATADHAGFDHHTTTREACGGWQQEMWVFEEDPRLRVLRAQGTCAAHLFLALAHATTASFLPDPFLGMTGTERAVVLLRDQGHPGGDFWTSDEPCKRLLSRLCEVSPRRRWYPPRLQNMENVGLDDVRPVQAQPATFALLLHTEHGLLLDETEPLHRRAFQRHTLRDLRGGSRWTVPEAPPPTAEAFLWTCPDLTLVDSPLQQCTRPLQPCRSSVDRGDHHHHVSVEFAAVEGLLDENDELQLSEASGALGWATWCGRSVGEYFVALHRLGMTTVTRRHDTSSGPVAGFRRERFRRERFRRLLSFLEFMTSRDSRQLGLLAALRCATDNAVEALVMDSAVEPLNSVTLKMRHLSNLEGVYRAHQVREHVELENCSWDSSSWVRRRCTELRMHWEDIAQAVCSEGRFDSSDWRQLTYGLPTELLEDLRVVRDHSIAAWKLHATYVHIFEQRFTGGCTCAVLGGTEAGVCTRVPAGTPRSVVVPGTAPSQTTTTTPQQSWAAHERLHGGCTCNQGRGDAGSCADVGQMAIGGGGTKDAASGGEWLSLIHI